MIIENPIIFYGAGRYAARNLERWLSDGMTPVCFADADERKHFTKFPAVLHGEGQQYEVLPLHEAIKLYQNARIYITLHPNNWDAVMEALYASGIAKERIIHADKYEIRKGCSLIGSFVHIIASPSGLAFRTCCHQPKPYYYNGTKKHEIKDAYSKFREYVTDLINRLRNDEPTECDGCVELHEGYWEINPDVSILVMYGGWRGERCNVKCLYCNAVEAQSASSMKDSWSYFDVLVEIGEFLPKGVVFSPQAGEFTISPHNEDIFRMIKKNDWQGHFLTNGFLFDINIARMMSARRASVNISVDAGTRETFSRIKGIDYWGKLISNLEKYAATGGELQLKYILLEGINDREDDVDGFIDIAEQFATCIFLSIDTFKTSRKTSLSPVCKRMVARFIEKAQERNLTYYIEWAVFNGSPHLVAEMKEILGEEL